MVRISGRLMTAHWPSAVLAIVICVGCTAQQQYASPQQSADSACRVFGTKALIGGLGGALSGAALGAAVSSGDGGAALIGAGVGLLAGLAAGKSQDTADCQQAKAAMQAMAVAPIGDATTWSNETTGSHGAYRPVTAAFLSDTGRTCRRYETSYQIRGGEVQNESGLTCRDAAGDWVRW